MFSNNLQQKANQIQTGGTNYEFNSSKTQLQGSNSQYDFNNVKQMPPPTSYGVNNSQSRAGKPLGTSMQKQGAELRPLTSNRAAKYGKEQDSGVNSTSNFKDLDKKQENSVEQNFKQLEREINRLVEDCAMHNLKKEFQEALVKAKEAIVKEKTLRKQKEQANLVESINIELTYSVSFNLAVQYQNNQMPQEALQKYNEIIKSKQFPQAGRLRVNMGNIYFQQKKYPIAIKMYRMALDIIPASSKEMRLKIIKNIGISFVKLGQFHEAISSFETIMKGGADFQTAFNLILCLYALGDVEKIKQCFVSMIAIEIPGLGQNDEDDLKILNQIGDNNTQDQLNEEIKEKRRAAIKYITDAAKLIASTIEEDDVIQGFQWIIDCLQQNQNFPEVESEIDICKALAHLKKKNIDQAIETLKSFEKKDKLLMAKAASNISFLYFLENDIKNAEKYAEIAIDYDRYNAKALVNRGNCFFMRSDFLRAKEQYLEAIGVEADCIEALYNLAFVNKKLNMFVEALQALEKLQSIISHIPEVVYQIANIHELMGNTKQALKWYQVLASKTPTDSSLLARLGALCAREEDEDQALHYFTESYRYMPVNLETISWLGIYYVKNDLYERACHFFERASQIQPKELKWKLMVASCLRRMGSFQRALKVYEDVNQEDPTNIECLRFLVQICKEMQLPYEAYAANLNKLMRIQQEQGNGDYDNYNYDRQQEQQQYGEEEIQDDNININVKSKQNQKQVNQQINKNDDNWANNEDIDDLLI